MFLYHSLSLYDMCLRIFRFSFPFTLTPTRVRPSWVQQTTRFSSYLSPSFSDSHLVILPHPPDHHITTSTWPAYFVVFSLFSSELVLMFRQTSSLYLRSPLSPHLFGPCIFIKIFSPLSLFFLPHVVLVLSPRPPTEANFLTVDLWCLIVAFIVVLYHLSRKVGRLQPLLYPLLYSLAGLVFPYVYL